MNRDRFWLMFLSTIVVITVTGVGLLRLHGVVVKLPSPNVQDITIVPGEDPFVRPSARVTPTTPYVYRESLSYGFIASTWSARVDWRSPQVAYEGDYSAQITFTDKWGGVYIATPHVSTSTYATLSFAILPLDSISELYIEAYDAQGRVIGREPVGWYTTQATLFPGRWQVVRMPLRNIGVGVGEVPEAIAIMSPTVGTLYLDDMTFAPDTITHSQAPIPESESL